MATLIGDGLRREYSEPIPGVYLPSGSDIAAELRRLFPRSHFPALWAKYPDQFRGAAVEVVKPNGG